LIPQFDFACFGVLVWSLIISLVFFYGFTVLIVTPSFVELEKLKLKRLLDEDFCIQTFFVDKSLYSNLKVRRNLN